MRSTRSKQLLAGACALALGIGLVWTLAAVAEEAAGWSLNATAIESCTCPMFCTCYFSDHPASHGGHHGEDHFCRFNMAYKVNHGHHGGTDLSGVKFWIAGDLGNEFGDGEADWSVVTFDPATTPEQRAGIAAALPAVFPIEWKSFSIGEDAAIEWQADGDRAVGKLDGGKAAEIVLTGDVLKNTDDPVVISNLKYWGVPRNDGFVLMPNQVNAYRLGPNAFESNGTNGFMITIDMSSDDVPAPAAADAPAEGAPAGE
jgi:hypothetical protein